MPASDSQLAITKRITWVVNSPSRGLPAIQGEVMVFDALDGRWLHLLDGPTVTAHRTAAVSLLAAQHLAPDPQSRLLLVGAGVQARAHLHAFVQVLGVKEVWVASRTRASVEKVSFNRPCFFKSCGWAGWDLAAARCVVQTLRRCFLIHNGLCACLINCACAWFDKFPIHFSRWKREMPIIHFHADEDDRQSISVSIDGHTREFPSPPFCRWF